VAIAGAEPIGVEHACHGVEGAVLQLAPDPADHLGLFGNRRELARVEELAIFVALGSVPVRVVAAVAAIFEGLVEHRRHALALSDDEAASRSY
jgi:hypothetical protein